MRAMSNLLDAAPTPQHDVNKEEVHCSLPAVPAVSPAAEARCATDAATNADEGNIGAEDSFHDRACVSPDAHSAIIPDPASQPRSMEQAFAIGMLNRQHGEGVAQVQPQQVPAEAEADTESGEEADDEASQAKEEQALAAARRQQTVDDAMDKLLEDLADEASSSKLPTPGRAASVSDMEMMNTADSGLLLLGSYASSSTASSTAAGTAPEREEQDFAYTDRYPHLDEDEEHQRQKEEDRAEEQGDKEVEKEDHGGEEGDDAELQALALLEMQGYTGLERAFRQLPQPDSPPTCRSPTGLYTSKDRSLCMHELGLMESGFKPRAAAEVASEEGASSSTPRLTAPTSSSAAATAAAKPAVQTLARPNQQPSNRLPSLALSRSSRKIVKATPDEETVLVPSQQASGLTSHQPQAREQGKHLSSAEMQHLMEFVFQRGFEHMGQIADASLADPAASVADVDVPGAATTTMPDLGRVEKTHDEMKDAFNKLVLHGRQRHHNHNRTELKGAALSQAVASATTTSISTRITAATATRAATAGSSIPEGAAAVASAPTSRHPSDMDSVPKALIARERVRVAQNYMEDEVPPFHSVFSRYDSNRHVREIQELTQCQRQVGFAAQQKQRPSQLKTALKVLLPGVMLATGIATGMRRLCKG